MPEQVFTPDEVHSLNEYQNSGFAHPFTCGSGHRTEHPDGEGILVATTQGWVCPYCDYRQDWAHVSMKNGAWKRTTTYAISHDLRRLAALRLEFYDELLAAVLLQKRTLEAIRTTADLLNPSHGSAPENLVEIDALVRTLRVPVGITQKVEELLDKMKTNGLLTEPEKGTTNAEEKNS